MKFHNSQKEPVRNVSPLMGIASIIATLCNTEISLRHVAGKYVKLLMYSYKSIPRVLFLTLSWCEHLLSRLHCVRGVTGSDCSRHAGQHLCYVRPAQHAFSSDFAYGTHGPTRRHLETSGLRGVCSQQGGNERLINMQLGPYVFGRWHKVRFSKVA